VREGEKEHKELLWRKVKGRGKGRRNYEGGKLREGEKEEGIMKEES